MIDRKKWDGDTHIEGTDDIEKAERYRKEITHLVEETYEMSGCKLEQEPTLSPLTQILIRMENRPPGDTRCLPEIKHLKKNCHLYYNTMA